MNAVSDASSVLVLGGGPDAERDISIASATAIAEALQQTWAGDVRLELIDRLTLDELRTLPGDVVFPALHGLWGEGGALQVLLEADGRRYVGVGPAAARLAMDKVATKATAMGIGLRTCAMEIVHPKEAAGGVFEGPARGLPAVVKPVHEGSSVGLFVCRTPADWHTAMAHVAGETVPYFAEQYVAGREVTASIVAGRALPLVEICPAEGLYDYAAKYQRDDTRYIPVPDLPASVGEQVQQDSLQLARLLGATALCRADWIVDAEHNAWLLECNTMPGFTSRSLVPMAAAVEGAWPTVGSGKLVRGTLESRRLEFGELCAVLVQQAQGAAERSAGAKEQYGAA